MTLLKGRGVLELYTHTNHINTMENERDQTKVKESNSI